MEILLKLNTKVKCIIIFAIKHTSFGEAKKYQILIQTLQLMSVWVDYKSAQIIPLLFKTN